MRAQRISIFQYLILCFTVLFLAGCGEQEKLAAIPAGTTVLILGDSLSYGTGAGKGQDYPSLLAQASAWQIINAGVPGDTSAQGLARLPALLDIHQPGVLMVELGGNDFLKKVPESQTITNLKTIIQTGKASGASVVLIAIPDYQPVKAAFGGLEDHALYADIAEEMQVPLIEDMFSSVLSDNGLKADYVHPNAAGYQRATQSLRQSLEAFGLLQSTQK